MQRFGSDLALLLFSGVYCQWEGGVNADVELGKVIIQIRLTDLHVHCEDV